ncbi:MAG: EGF domain-containing protein [Polyangiaceae bacterium]
MALPGSHTGAVLDLVNLSNKNEPGAFQYLVAAGQLPQCGNGNLDLCEVCDDGNASNNDGCTNVCQQNVCGDGYVHTGVEDCDVLELGDNADCPAGTLGTPMCNNDPANPNGDGSCTLSFPPAGCIDIDECADGALNDCNPNATCTNTPGSFLCECNQGYAGDGITCDDVNECVVGSAGCSPNATCANTIGSFTCTCKPGFEGDGFTCITIDSDGDGLSDVLEQQLGTDPFDQDSDDDGVIDGQEPQPGFDSDGDGLINALDPDSDNDGIFDGTEMGFDCSNPDTDLSAGNCVPDADNGLTITNPLNPDTDGGGVLDGAEDWNHNGAIDPGETDPANGSGDDATVVDTDGDGASDALEIANGTNPFDADSDDDGVIDGLEVNPTQDTDGDGLINMLDPDSDNDGIFDGTEMGKNCQLADTDLSKGHCIPDADPSTKTSPVLADTDGGGAQDGAEDFNSNGKIDAGETDPTVGHAADDVNVIDSDGDGLSDGQELEIGSDPFDSDTDDDGIPDGAEANPTADDDGDGLPNAADADSDNDGILDGTEIGISNCNGAAQCVPDGDGGATTTGALNPDSDGGGVKDGVEDKNQNGIVDPGETDPNNPFDDVCMMSSECAIESQVCDAATGQCVDPLCDASLQCPTADACHLPGMCDPVSGMCAYANAPAGAPCEDGNPCTDNKCNAGTCGSISKLDGTTCTKNGLAGQCIAGECLVDSGIGNGGAGGDGGNGNGGNGNGGNGNGGNGNGGNGNGANANGGAGGDGNGGNADDGTYNLLGGGCATSPTNSAPPAGALLALGLAAAAVSRRRRKAVAKNTH